MQLMYFQLIYFYAFILMKKTNETSNTVFLLLSARVNQLDNQK